MKVLLRINEKAVISAKLLASHAVPTSREHAIDGSMNTLNPVLTLFLLCFAKLIKETTRLFKQECWS